MCHGFPGLWYSWRHQLPALAAAGFRAVAPDMRGYGQTDRPPEVERYTLLHLAGDMVGVLDALQVEQAAIVGHDWGAPVAWNAALMRPDRFRAVAGLSVPYLPRGGTAPTTVMPRSAEAEFYQLYFQAPGVAEAEFERDVARSLRTLLTGRSAPGDPGMVRFGGGFLDGMAAPETLPAWLGEGDLAVMVEAFEHSGFAGGLNWYRNIDRNWELMAPFAGAPIAVPALYMGGDHDLVVRFMGGGERIIDRLKRSAPHLRDAVILPNCGHWTQQERPEEVNAALLKFLRGL
jgi:pimeloyl-ACP methyl ester carboxylesterase